MQYKKSRYNVEIDHLEDGRILLYNTYTGIFGIMDVDTQAIYNHIENVDVDTIEDRKLIDNCEILIKYGYIVDSETDELASFLLERANERVRRGWFNLTIAPTMACNMRCPYCYESKNGKTMSKSTQNKLIRFVESHLSMYPDIKRMRVVWYGGEPLLQKDTIYNLSEEFLRLCSQAGVDYDATIITNGVLLDKETAWKLHNECNVRRAQITIDGMPEQHNKRRVLVDGSGSYDCIVRNIEDCRSFMNIVIRMNVDKTNEEGVYKFLQFAVHDMNWLSNPKIYIAPVDSYTENCAHTMSTCFANSEFADIRGKFQNMNYSIDRTRVKNDFFPRRRVLHCSAEQLNNYVIDPEGYFYNCWMVIGDTRYSTGHIDKPFVCTHEYYRWLSSELPLKCKQCEYLPLCAGGCGYFRIIKDGQPNCTATFYSYKNTLKLAYYDYTKQKQADSTSKQ